jgi:PAS domain S-box-containing protein
MRKAGIEIIAEVPWGAHFCQFYRSPADLVEILAPYFRQGLQQNERCIWLTSEPLHVEQAKEAMEEVVPDLESHLGRGQFEITASKDLYGDSHQDDPGRVLADWRERARSALARGYEGLRIGGDVCGLRRRNGRHLRGHEAAVDDAVSGQHAIALCSYPIEECGIHETLRAVGNHQFSMIKEAGRWQILESRESRRIETALWESEAWLRLAQRAALVGVWELDLSAGESIVSEEVARMYGLETPSGPLAFNWTPHVHPEDQERLAAWCQQARETGDDQRFEFRIIRPDGEIRWLLSFGYTIDDPSRRSSRMIGVTVDVTERKRAEEQVKILNETLEKRVAERTAVAERRAAQLLAMSSALAQAEERERRRLAQTLHDHLQPLLVAARLRTSLASRKLTDREPLMAIHQVVELLDQSISESRSLTVELSPPVLYDRGLVGGLEWLARRAKQKHFLQVNVELDAEAEPRSESIRVFLFQVVRELLLNVTKHAQTSSAHVELTGLGEDWLRIIVTDTGRGFDIAMLESRGAPIGFGLFSIRERLELIGGRLEVDAEPGRGTRVVLEAPRGQPLSPAAQARKAVAAASSEALDKGPAAIESARRTGKITVMVADDHRVLREGLITMLREQSDLEVIGEASDGRQAVELALRMKPEVVFMDVSMPIMDGIEATRRITEALPQIRVIGLSMHESADMATAMQRAGAVGYLSKATDCEAMVAAIRECAVTE